MPGVSVVFHPAAVEEAQAARQWYAARSQSAADSFLAELDGGIEAISLAPERWPLFAWDSPVSPSSVSLPVGLPGRERLHSGGGPCARAPSARILEASLGQKLSAPTHFIA